MNKKNIFLITILLLFLSSCGSNTVYKKFLDLSKNVQWNRDLVLEYQPKIEDNKANYNIFFELNHHSLYPYQNAIINVNVLSPSGKETQHQYILNVKGNDGKNAGKGVGDYWDYRQLVEMNFQFEETGEYKFLVSHGMPKDVFTDVFRLGLIISKAE